MKLAPFYPSDFNCRPGIIMKASVIAFLGVNHFFPYICNVKRMLLAKYAFQLIRLYFVTDWILIEYISFQD